MTVAHRLLKNAAADRTGSAAYALFTHAAEFALALELDDAVRFIEPIDGAEPVDVTVIALG